MAVLENPEHHLAILEALMHLREDESHTYQITQIWVARPVVGRTTEEGPKIEQAMKTNSEDIQNRIYADIPAGPPPEGLIHRNLDEIIPARKGPPRERKDSGTITIRRKG